MLKVFYSALEPIFKGLEKEGFEKNGFFNFKKTFQTKKSIKTKKTVGVVSFFSTMTRIELLCARRAEIFPELCN